MRFFAVTALLTLSVSALPTVDNSVRLARSASPEAIADGLVESARLYARGRDIKWASMPSKSAACPATARYGAHTFTENQIKVAFLGGAGLSAEGKQLGQSRCIPNFHAVSANVTKMPTPTSEFPILFSNSLYTGESVQEVPDRVLYEAREKGGSLLIKYCGVIRHGDDRDFVDCP